MDSLLILYACGFLVFFGFTIGVSKNESFAEDMFTGLLIGAIWPILAVAAVAFKVRGK